MSCRAQTLGQASRIQMCRGMSMHFGLATLEVGELLVLEMLGMCLV